MKNRRRNIILAVLVTVAAFIAVSIIAPSANATDYCNPYKGCETTTTTVITTTTTAAPAPTTTAVTPTTTPSPADVTTTTISSYMAPITPNVPVDVPDELIPPAIVVRPLSFTG